MASKQHVTTDHEEIRHWVEEHGGQPAEVAATGTPEDPGILRIDFPGFGEDENLDDLSWDAFFRKFEEKQLAFLYQEETKDGKPSRFSKFISRDSLDGEDG